MTEELLPGRYVHPRPPVAVRESRLGARPAGPVGTPAFRDPGQRCHRRLFPDAREAVRALSLQESAVVVRGDGEGLAEAGIDLPIPLEDVRPLRVEAFASQLLAPWLADAPLFAYLVPRVPLRVLWERGA